MNKRRQTLKPLENKGFFCLSLLYRNGSTAAESTTPSGNAAAEGTVPAQVNAGASGAETPPNCLVLCGLRDKRLDKVLFELRRADIPIDYKAILTPSNQEWTVPELMKELQRERQAMGR